MMLLKRIGASPESPEENYLFRPMEFKPSGLILSWVVHQDIICNTIIKEGPKADESEISDELEIEGRFFSNLGQIKVEYLDRVKLNIQEVVAKDYFKPEYSKPEL